MILFAVTLVTVSAIWWLTQALLLVPSITSVPRLRAVNEPALEKWPLVSVIVPARNEAESLEEGIASRLSEGYPNLQIVIVNDRSEDSTGAIADRLAARDSRVKVVHVTELPTGWLGKLNAMQRGLEIATGDWVLLSDADVQLTPGTMQRVMSWAESRADHVGVLPSLTTAGPVITLTLTGFFRMVTSLTRLWAVPTPRSSAFFGIGAFNLFRRSSYDASPGLEWLKMEIGDDVALGYMLKKSGARQAVLMGNGFVQLQFYGSVKAMVQALEKNGAQAPALLTLGGLVVLCSLELGYLAAFALPYGPAFTAVFWILASLLQWRVCAWVGLKRWPALFPGVSSLVLAWAMARSALLAFIRGGVRWRGTFYPTKTVRAGQRLGKRLPVATTPPE